jgi:sec-independent protein translocase protein TatC
MPTDPDLLHGASATGESVASAVPIAVTAPITAVTQPVRKLEPEEGARMSFFDHLNELRKRLMWSFGAIVVGTMIAFAVSQKVFAFIAKPMLLALRHAHLEEKLVYTSPTGVINLLITISLYLGIVIALPVVLYQVWLFIAPGLYKHERSAVLGFISSSFGLFLAGVAFGYYILLPYMLKFLIGFQGPFKPLISINEYFDLILIVLLGLGVIFEMPILIFFLTLFGLVTPQFLLKNFRYAMLIITVIAAIVTPTPDALTMLIFMSPMIGLYFVSIGVSYMVVRRKRAREALTAGTP